MSAIAAGELWYGLERIGSGDLRRNALRSFLGRIKILPWDSDVADAYGAFRAHQEAIGRPLGPLDTQIAAHAIAVGAILSVTTPLFKTLSVYPALSAGQTTSEIKPMTDQPFRLDNRHALVTGGASGIGEATVRELVRAGAFVYIADINIPAGEALAASLPSTEFLHLDVTSPTSIAAAVAKIERLDILVNNAGIGHVGSIEATEPEDFDRLLNVNVRSVYLVTRAFLPLLLAGQPEGIRAPPAPAQSLTSPPSPALSASNSASPIAPPRARSSP